MVAMTQQTFSKTPRQMLRSLAEDLLRRVEDYRCEPLTTAQAARDYAAMIVAECERELGVSHDRH